MANIFSRIGQAWSNMPLQNKLYMGTVITDKLAGSYNFGGVGLAMANASMKLDGQPGTFSDKKTNTNKPSQDSLTSKTVHQVSQGAHSSYKGGPVSVAGSGADSLTIGKYS